MRGFKQRRSPPFFSVFEGAPGRREYLDRPIKGFLPGSSSVHLGYRAIAGAVCAAGKSASVRALLF
jgi:hypothetical protein